MALSGKKTDNIIKTADLTKDYKKVFKLLKMPKLLYEIFSVWFQNVLKPAYRTFLSFYEIF